MGKKISDFLKINIFKGDKVIWMIYFLLCMVSLVEIYSAGSNLTFKGGEHYDPLLNQAKFLILGFFVMVLVNNIPCKYFKLISLIGLPAAILMLLFTLVKQSAVNDAARWITIAGIKFQPSEFAKSMLLLQVAVVLARGNLLGKKRQGEQSEAVRKKAVKRAFWTVVILTAIVCGLIVPENFSTAAMTGLVVLVIMYVANLPWRYLIGLVGSIAACVTLVGFVIFVTPDEKLQDYRRALTWKNRLLKHVGTSGAESGGKTYNMEEHWQEVTARMSIADSNGIGVGPGNSVCRDFLPHAESDFIYAIIVEEMGVAGGIGVLLLYIILLVRVWRIAQRSDKYFPAYLIIGLGTMLVTQALVNMSVAVGLAPVTGQTLPLISHGGTSILITSFNLGMILSVSRYTEKVNAERKALEASLALNETTEFADSDGMV